MTRDQVVRAIYEAIDLANQLRDPGRRLALDEEATLYAEGAGLDSLGLVSLLMDVEQAVNDRTGGGLVLADERAMARRKNPFRTVGSLADYVMERLGEGRACTNPPSS